MINIKKTICAIVISLICVSEAIAEINDALFATVGSKAITRSDIVNEVKVILITNGKSFSEAEREKLQSAAIQSTIKRTIKEIEIAKYALEYNEVDLDIELRKMANNINMDYETFKNTFEANGIDFSQVVDRMKTELLWNSLIFELYKDRLLIDQEELEEQLKLVQNKKEIEEYLISEIIIKSVQASEIESKVKEIKNKIKIEGFEKVALDLSISETSLRGGDLGWVNENLISREFKNVIANTPIGNISQPIFLPDGILIFKVRDKRKKEKFVDLEEAKNQLVNAEKSKILSVHSLSHFDNVKRSTPINYYLND